MALFDMPIFLSVFVYSRENSGKPIYQYNCIKKL
jgi:hypothetical protein